MKDPVSKYFNSLPQAQKDKLYRLEQLYKSWNNKINLVSRKDIDNFVLHHVIHALRISLITGFSPGTKILDAGTGGGFPGVPLAVIFPGLSFTLADSVGKKINALEDIREKTALHNVEAVWTRVEDINDRYDFVVSRAVAPFPELVKWTGSKILRKSRNSLPNGIIALKGGDLSKELAGFSNYKIWELKDYFEEEYFKEKKIVYMPIHS